MKRILLLLPFSLTFLLASGIDYLNDLRTKAGLPPFSVQAHLQAAARNHSVYLQLNNTSGHVESKDKNGFTGEYPWDRAVYAGYPSRLVSENVSGGQKSEEESIDNLFSAIYHRFGFLSLEDDEIGIGVSDDMRHYTYDMGNAAVRKLCTEGSYSGGAYYTGVCADVDQKVDAEALMAAIENQKRQAPELVIWPPDGASDILPVFFEETPDPLPDYAVSGYPVSVQFNDAKFDEPPTLESFTLLREETQESPEILKILDRNNDPNNKFSGYEFALFPKKRLEWGTAYLVRLSWRYGGEHFLKEWCFATRSLKKYAEKVYRIEGDDATLDVVSGRTYALYLVPRDGNDTARGFSYRYNVSDVSMEFIDANTFAATVRGEKGRYVEISFSDGRSVKLIVSDSDWAQEPSAKSCPAVDGDSQTSSGNETVQEEEQTSSNDTTGGPADENGSGVSQNETPTATPLPVETENGDGSWQPADSGTLVLSDTLSTIEVKSVDGKLRYTVSVGEVVTTVSIPVQNSLTRIDRNHEATIRSEGSDPIVRVLADGRVEILSEKTPHPTNLLPAGTEIRLEEERLRVRIPVEDEIRF